MEPEIFAFKNKLSELIPAEEMKVWLCKKEGKRRNFIFKLGQEQFSTPQTVAENQEYCLLAQQIDEQLKKDLTAIFNHYLERRCE
ncbi:hypothetical protein [Fuchsiella alkaliacetigena]|uniref:hypothetical protein n=1 Tax=Fuchsiella alkaliacetigena TaxID=957042 RepID=UPI00200B20E5|nr:hypothetical protein [Fuchsiella alkaliacetigena]MCK8825758.1 hypothetical protein [Fuchsiella alkaliacetigena]